jgi:SAM-dependent methyltransferase
MTSTTTTFVVDPTNLLQAQMWDGDEGAHWAQHQTRYDAAIARFHPAFMAAAAITAADRVLDIGCGTGQTTLEAARSAVDGHALGIDLSSQMVDAARRSAATVGISNARFVTGDAQVHPFEPAGYDVAISRTGAMFFGAPRDAFANIARSLRPGGRLALLAWQGIEANEWLREISAVVAAGGRLPFPTSGGPGPTSLGDPSEVRALLSAAGFADVALDGVRAPMVFGTDADEASTFLWSRAGHQLAAAGADESGRWRAEALLRDSVERHASPEGVLYDAAAWLVTARRPG